MKNKNFPSAISNLREGFFYVKSLAGCRAEPNKPRFIKIHNAIDNVVEVASYF